MTRGRLVTLEGIDGAGKSTHVQALAHRLARGGVEVVVTREPGGTPLAESLRAHLLEQPMDTLTEALLVFAARRDHLHHVIEPALERGATVLCDRFTDATFAYQGAGRGLDVETLSFLESKVQEGRQPDLTLWFDVPASVAAQRRSAARDPDRFEQLDEAFFDRVRAGYAQRANQAAQRFARLNAQQDRDAVWRDIERVLAARGW
jgi:dTMP kinase